VLELVPIPIPKGVIVEESGPHSLVVVLRRGRIEGEGCRIFVIIVLIGGLLLVAGELARRGNVGAASFLGAVGLLIPPLALYQHFLTMRFTFVREELAVRRLFLGVTRTRRIPRASLARIQLAGPDRSRDGNECDVFVYLPKRVRLLSAHHTSRVSPWFAQLISSWSGITIEGTVSNRRLPKKD
jgi:hypothetical protein